MKKVLFLFIFLCICRLNYLLSQCSFTATISANGPTLSCGGLILSANTNLVGNWLQMASLPIGRIGGTAFSIGNKGYVGTGIGIGSNSLFDFWEYDPLTNNWTRKANFAGAARFGAVGFSIGNKGYIGSGTVGTVSNNVSSSDFWEYDPVSDSWTQRANIGNVPRTHAVGFSIGNKGYVATGTSYVSNNGTLSSSYLNDFWEYNPLTNSWFQLANFPGFPRQFAVAFVIGGKAYVGAGRNNSTAFGDFWEYDPSINIWIQKANFGGGVANASIGFSIGSKGYLCTGIINNSTLNVFWEFDPITNNWQQKINFGGSSRDSGCGFVIGNQAFVGFGYSTGTFYQGDLWRYDLGAGFLWSTGSTLQAISANSSGTYTLAVTNSTGCTITSSMSIVVLPNPTTAIRGPNSVCSGSNLILTASGANSYTWSSNAGAAVSPTVILTPSSNTIYSVTGSINSCTSVALSKITVKQPPLITVSLNSLICSGETTTISAFGANSYSWSNGSFNQTVIVTPSVNSTFTVIGTDTIGCSNFAITTVSVLSCTGYVNNSMIQDASFLIFPNPNNGTFKIQSTFNIDELSYELYTCQGLLIKSGCLRNNMLFELESYDEGLFYLKIFDHGNLLLSRIVLKQ